MKKTVLVILIISISWARAQVLQIDSLISKNQITPYQNQKLFLVDFWATWCVPCIPATQQLEILQESIMDKVYMISLSDESPEKIHNFLKRKPIRLAVVSDHSMKSISKYNITSRPYAVLMDYSGKTLWAGKPGDLNQRLIENFYSKVKGKNSYSWSELFQKPIIKKIEKLPLDTSNFQPLWAQFIEIYEEGYQDNEEITYTGKLKDFLVDYIQISPFQISDQPILNRYVKIKLKISQLQSSESRTEIYQHLLSEFNLAIDSTAMMMDVTVWKVKDYSNLWDTAQIDWGLNSPKYLVGTPRVQGNDVSIREIANKVSALTGKTILYQGKNNNKYDWDFTYEIEDLMKEELNSSYGIISVKEKVRFSVYTYILKESIKP